MKKLMDKSTIITLKQKGNSSRAVAKALGINRKTVARYWNEFCEQIAEIDEADEEGKSLIQEKIFSEPKYNSSNRKKHKYTDEIDAYVDKILGFEDTKVKDLGRHKQDLTIKQIHELVIEQGFEISKSTISNYVKKKRDKAKECFIKQDYNYGDRLEYDFGEVKLLINGKTTKYHLAVLSSPASNFRWAYLYKNQRNEVFMDSHVKFFKMVGGVYKEVVYDNMRNVVAKFIGRSEKELNPKLLMLAGYYGFDINVTNCFKGNEKGHVEGSVKIIRKEAFAKEYIFESYEAAQLHLEKTLLKLNEGSEIEKEKSELKKMTAPLELGKVTEQKVNSYSLIQVDKCQYSVPDYLTLRKVTVRTYQDRIKVYSNEELVCTHKKKDGANEVTIDINHYLPSLAKKPGAIRNSVALKSEPLLKSIFDTHFSKEPKKFIELLIENKDKSTDEILEALKVYATFKGSSNPVEIYPHKSSIELKTKKMIGAYKKLKTGGLN